MELDRLFGGRVRSETLQALAATSRPQSAYRLAKAIDAQPIQVLTTLKGLAPWVEHVTEGWVLRDDVLRHFLRLEYRRRERVLRDEKDELLLQLGLRPSLERGRN
ncbi:MAG: hypothetical protein L3K00_07345 [Thermoplasmata archaeon]|nr:hypothetical protein [Thermoplasmata archaeon]